MVYVDKSLYRYGRMVMCHMIADSTQELLAMAGRIGVKQRWLQNQGTPREHFDICMAKRALAVECGAVELGTVEFGRRLLSRSPKGRELLKKYGAKKEEER